MYGENQYKLLMKCSAKKDLSEWNLLRMKSTDTIVMSRANLEGAFLVGANLEGIYFVDANFVGANLEGANLKKVILVGANLEDANLKKASLVGANLESANFKRAILIDADLEGAVIDGVNFDEAKLDRSYLREIIADCMESKKKSDAEHRRYIVHFDSALKTWAVSVSSNKEIENVFKKITGTVILSDEERDEQKVPLWLRFKTPVEVNEIAIALSVLNKLYALIYVFHREKATLPAFALSINSDSPWEEKERREQERRMVSIFSNPTNAVDQNERLYLRRTHEGSYYFGLGIVPKWICKKLEELWNIIPEWKIAKAKAKYINAKTQAIEKGNEYIAQKTEIEIEREQEKLYEEHENRIIKGAERRLDLIKKMREHFPELKALPPKAVIAFLNELITTVDDSTLANDNLGAILTGDEAKTLPNMEEGEQKYQS